MNKRIVLDTNRLVSSLPRKGKYHRAWQDFFNNKYVLCYTNEILTEYEEILTQKMGRMIAQNIIKQNQFPSYSILAILLVICKNDLYHFVIQSEAKNLVNI